MALSHAKLADSGRHLGEVQSKSNQLAKMQPFVNPRPGQFPVVGDQVRVPENCVEQPGGRRAVGERARDQPAEDEIAPAEGNRLQIRRREQNVRPDCARAVG